MDLVYVLALVGFFAASVGLVRFCANTQGRTFGILGEPRVNVVMLNLALERSSP